jgi:biopolymer transport protein ExbD
MQPSDVVTVEVLRDGTFVWNGQPVPDVDTLDQLWKTIAAQDPQPQIHFKANRDAKYEAVERALKGAQNNGVSKLGFVGNVAPQSP